MISRVTPPPAAELDALHEASLHVLEQVGVAFPSRVAQQVLAAAGALVNADTGVVRLPRRLVEDALASAPRDVLLAGRDAAQDVRCDGADVRLTLDDCELFRQCGRVRAGLTVDEEHLMLDVVAEIGPGGHFLKSRQTRKHVRTGELYTPRHLLREPYESWSEGRAGGTGRADATRRAAEVERATAEVEEILIAHRPKPLPDGARDRIAAIVAAAGRELGGR